MSRLLPKADRASVGVALIAKNAEHTLGRCLDSIRPYVEQIVVAVDVRSEDATRKVARKHGADRTPSVHVSHPHKCDLHGEIMAQHFAQARNESFTYLDRSLDWWLWIDADDVFEHGNKIRSVLSAVPETCVGVWLPYRYSTLGNGKVTNTVFHRERFLRTTQEWEWVYRVHEVVKPKREGDWFGTGEIDIWHQEGQHKSEDSAQRNLTLLEIDLEENPNDSRAIFYVGNQYFAMGRNEDAVRWYHRLVDGNLGNDYERWQASVYMGWAHLRLDHLSEATQSAYLALEEHPEHPEPYFLLASVSARGGNLSKCDFWTKLGRGMKEPPFFVFKNPMDYGFNNRTVLADALAREGYIPEAKAEWQAAYAFYQDESVGKAIIRADQIIAAGKEADRFVSFATYSNGSAHESALQKYVELPDEVRALGRVRDVIAPWMQNRMPTGRPKIAFWCGHSWEPWAPPSLQSGIGGSETAVIEIAKRFARDGWRVEVYNDPERFEGVYDHVGYWECKRYDSSQPVNIGVNWRQPQAVLNATRHILWCHDLNYGPIQSGALSHFKVLGVSAWHAKMLNRYYGVDAGYVPNGINLRDFQSRAKKVPMRCVYASSADRGLLRLLEMWPTIRSAESGAELHVAYGWNTIDQMINAGRRDLLEFKQHVEKKIAETPGAVWTGRLGKQELADLYASAYAWLYPTSFLEVSCISAMEAMAGGAVPVTSACGALRETVGDAGLIIPGLPESRVWSPFYVLQALAVLTDPNLRHPLSIRGKKRAEQLTWDISYNEHWKPLVEGLLEKKADYALDAV